MFVYYRLLPLLLVALLCRTFDILHRLVHNKYKDVIKYDLCHIPQSSVLRPLLFLTYTGWLEHFIKSHGILYLTVIANSYSSVMRTKRRPCRRDVVNCADDTFYLYFIYLFNLLPLHLQQYYI